MRSLISLAILAASLFAGTAVAEPHGHRRNHDSIARRANADVGVHKRFSGTRWTYYDVGLGACGKFNGPGDFIVALNSAQYGGGYPGPNCFKSITMTYNGKTTTATIVDECPGCPFGGLDLSRGLFTFFAPESAGVITGEWSFNDGSGGSGGGGGDDDDDEPPKTTSKYTPPPKPTSTWKPDPTTSKWEPPTTSKWEPPSTSEKPSSTSMWEPPSSTWSPPPSSSSSSSSSTSSSSATSSTPSVLSIDFASGIASGLAVPSGIIEESPQQSGPQGILTLNKALVNIGGLIVAGAQV